MDQQELITEIESLMSLADGIESFVKEANDFFNEPHSKLEIQSYITERSLDKLYDKKVVDELVLRLLQSSTTYNSTLFRQHLLASYEDFKLAKEFNFKYRKFVEHLYDYIEFIQAEIEKLTYDDVAERLMALRRTICKIKTIIMESTFAPFNEDNIREMTVDEDDQHFYLTSSFKQVLDRSKKVIFEYIDYFSDTFNWTERDSKSYVSKEKLISVRNLIFYLNTFVRY